MDRRRLLLNGGFPKEPSNYELISTYIAAGTFVAPENGWFQIEVFGASGNGGSPMWALVRAETDGFDTEYAGYSYYSGGGGGGGGYACSRVKMKKGDIIIFSPGGIGKDSTVTIQSSIEEYTNMVVTSGENGGRANYNTAASVGAGGIASGGNYVNFDGKPGQEQHKYLEYYGGAFSISAVGNGGAPGYTGGNTGGRGEGKESGSNGVVGDRYTNDYPATNGKPGFIKIYRGDTN